MTTCTRCHERPAVRLLIFAHGKSLADQPDPDPRCNPCTSADFVERISTAQEAGAVYSLKPDDQSRYMNDWFLQRLINTAIKGA